MRLFCRRHHVNSATQIDEFNQKLSRIIYMLNSQKSEFYIIGNINVELLQIHSKFVIKLYANSLSNRSFNKVHKVLTKITENTTTLLDHVYTNNHD